MLNEKFECIDDNMLIECQGTDLAEEYSTPVYVTDEDAVRKTTVLSMGRSHGACLPV